MGGPNLQPTQQLGQQQQQLFGQQVGLSQQQLGQMQGILQPLISQYTQQEALQQPAINMMTGLTSGDPNKVVEAAAPIISPITQQFAQAKENIQDTAPRGAAKDFALQQLPIQQSTAVAGAETGAIQSAFQTELGIGQGAQGALGNIASGLGGLSLQELGAGLTAGGQAGTEFSNIMQAQNQQKAATMGFLGSLAGAAGTAAGGYFKSQAPSDRRLKKNIRSLDMAIGQRALEGLSRVRPVQFDFVNGEREQVGVIAQELLEIFPDLVSVGKDGFYRVDYPRLAVMAITALKELYRGMDAKLTN